MATRVYGDFKLGPGDLLTKPDLASHIALVSSFWAEIEDTLAWLYALAMATNPVLAASALGRVNSLPARLDMIETALGFSISQKARNHFSREYRQEIRKCAGLRSDVIHAIWTVHADYPDCIIRTRGIADPEIEFWAYSLRDFQTIELRLLELHVALKEFGQSLAHGKDFEGPRTVGWQVRAPQLDSPE